MTDVFETLRIRFKSGNSVPVDRAHITRSEFDEIQRLRREKLAAERDALKSRIENAPRAVIGTGLNINIDTKDRGKASNMIGNRVRLVSMDDGGTV